MRTTNFGWWHGPSLVIPLLLAGSLAACSCGSRDEDLRRLKPKEKPVPASLEIVGADPVLFDALEAQIQLEVLVRDQHGDEMEPAGIAWRSLLPAVVQVDGASGLATSKSPGEAKLEASLGDLKTMISAKVEPAAVEVVVTPASYELAGAGQSKRFDALAYDRNAHPIPSATFLWRSADEAIATVDDRGTALAVAAGKTEIVAQVEGSEASGKAELIVRGGGAGGDLALRVKLKTPVFTVGVPEEVEVEVVNEAGDRVAGMSPAVTLAFGANPTGATLSGHLEVDAEEGLAVFRVAVDKAGQGYTLVAQAVGVEEGISAAFDVEEVTCGADWPECGDPPICVDTESNSLHCGGCGQICGVGQICVDGKCECANPSLEACNAICVDLNINPSHCGTCGNACPNGESCVGGSCGCLAVETVCDGVCTNTSLDPENCGSCGKKCDPGKVCVAGSCTTHCPGGQQLCGGACVNTQRDPNNCGACGKSCSGYNVCSDGFCMLDPEWANWQLPPESPTDYTTTAESSTVTDNVTFLIWQKLGAGQASNWHQAKATCDNLNIGGSTSWRLPTRIELLTIVDSGTKNPAINGQYFPNTPPSWFWAITQDANDPNKAWVVDFEYGYARTEPKSTVAEVRCVRFGPDSPKEQNPPIARYVVGDGPSSGGSAIRDQYTGIRWWSSTLGATPTMGSSYDHSRCQSTMIWEGLTPIPGHLPRKKALESLVDVRAGKPAIDGLFSASQYWEWTLTPHQQSPGVYVWGVNFAQGGTTVRLEDNTLDPGSFRCVW